MPSIPRTDTAPPSPRSAPLDGIRGIAILLVLIWHYYAVQIVVVPEFFGRYGSFGLNALILTWSGVDLFFVLSGFLIAGILLDHRDASNYFRIFYLRRVCRIFPLYFLVLGVFVCLTHTRLAALPQFEWLFGHPFPQWAYASFTQNFFMGARDDFGSNWLAATWSLAVEEQFYLVVPLLIYFLSRRVLIAMLVTAVLAAPLLRGLSDGLESIVETPWRSDALLSGALLAILVRHPPFLSAVRRHRNLVWILSALLLAAVTTLVDPAPGGAANHFLLAGLYSTLVLIAFSNGEGLTGRILGFAPLVALGQISYGVYLFHQPVTGLLHAALRQSYPEIRTLSDAAITVASLGVTLALAKLSFHFFERPLLRYGHSFQYATPETTKARSGAT